VSRAEEPDSRHAAALQIRRLSKTFSGGRVLNDISFDLNPGEVHALVGQNGSGKSTFIKILAGFHEADPGGEVRIGSEVATLKDPVASREAGFRFVHQDLGLVDTLDTVENLALGEGYRTAAAGRIRWGASRRDADQRMRELGYHFDIRRPVGDLAAAERTGIAIARALHDFESARYLVVDEPTASMPAEEVAMLFDAISRVKERGLGVIYVSHRLNEIFTIADRVSVLRDGRTVGTHRTADFDEDRLVKLMVGDVDLTPPVKRSGPEREEPVLVVENLCGEVLEDVSFVANAGEILGIAGLTGSGREEVLATIFGALPREGAVSVAGRSIRASSPSAAIDAGVAFVPADRVASGAIVGESVRQNLTLVDLRIHSRFAGRLSQKAETEETAGWISQLDVRPPLPEALFATLSGGNQQKVVLAKWLRVKPRVVLLDEPTQGVDVGAKASIHGLAREAANNGATVIIASSDDRELCDVCDRSLVLRDGRVGAELARADLSPERVARMQLSGAREAGR
jgi:ribose transport system ATP-binding protein